MLNLAEDLEVDLANDQKVLQKMFERMDEDGSGLVSFEELVAGARKDPEFQSRLRVMDIDEADLRQLFDMIDTTGMGEIESSEFIAALSRWVHDSKTAPRFVKYNMLRSLEMQDDLYHIVREQFEFLFQQIDSWFCSHLHEFSLIWFVFHLSLLWDLLPLCSKDLEHDMNRGIACAWINEIQFLRSTATSPWRPF